MYENHKWIMMTISHILVPYDGTIDSDRGFEDAIKLCKKYSCKLTIISCFYESSVDILYADFKNMILEKLKKFKNKTDIDNVSFSHIFVKSIEIVKEIVSFSSKNNVDMIIIGSSQPSGLKKLFVGSISEELQKNAKCIVKIVK